MNMAIFSLPRADSTTRTGEAGEHDGGDVIGRIRRRDDSALSVGMSGPASGARRPRRAWRPAAQSSTARIMSNQTGRRMVELIAHSSLLRKLLTNPLKVLLDPSGHP